MKILHHTLRLLLALVFLFAGSIKLAYMAEFAVSVGDFGLVPDWFVWQTAWLVTLSELAIGAGLTWNLRASLLAALILLGIFVGVLVYAIMLGLDIQCGCFGPDFHVSLQTQLVLDISLILLCGAIIWSRKSCLDLSSPGSPDHGGVSG